MPEPTSRLDREKIQPGDIVESGTSSGVVLNGRISADRVVVDWSGATAPRLGANTWILSDGRLNVREH